MLFWRNSVYRLLTDYLPSNLWQQSRIHSKVRRKVLQDQVSAGETLSVTRLSYLLSGFEARTDDGDWKALPAQFAWQGSWDQVTQL